MLEPMAKIQWKKQIRFYGILLGVCLILAEGVKKAWEDMKGKKP